MGSISTGVSGLEQPINTIASSTVGRYLFIILDGVQCREWGRIILKNRVRAIESSFGWLVLQLLRAIKITPRVV